MDALSVVKDDLERIIKDIKDDLLKISGSKFLITGAGDLHWFIFNFADVFITLGVFFMILSEFIGNNNVKNYEKT